MAEVLNEQYDRTVLPIVNWPAGLAGHGVIALPDEKPAVQGFFSWVGIGSPRRFRCSGRDGGDVEQQPDDDSAST